MLRVTAPHFVAGISYKNDRLVAPCAPILRWAIGKNLDWFLDYCKKKRWSAELLP